MLDAWREAGPLRVEHEVARRLSALASEGVLRVANPARTARHYIAVTTAEITSGFVFRAAPLTDQQVREIIAAGVEAFLNGYAA